ncbi:transmembrane 9 superfamily member 11-like [Dioscorea cayenensis subsp. rotundata]|uniref:Transmembrane 9 superfamily member n=1 Tax=Dioscorea cayennensis subsp. rotundata TaxID=55577 RepID=A0AB40BLA8_DIOCR|nr:transmembrane 9 superfamily member 11-like [Dioscorea cayenensis subsp. rotundata]
MFFLLSSRMSTWTTFLLPFLQCCLMCSLVQAFYLPGTYPHWYVDGGLLFAKVNSLTSFNTELPFGYYTLPFCQPTGGVKQMAESLGELLMGDRVENSPYRFKMNTNEAGVFLCSTGPLSSHQVNTLKQRIDKQYNVNLILDGLPAIRYTEKDGQNLQGTGYPVGVRSNDSYYVFNHLKFKIMVHKSNVADYLHTIVGFKVTACSHNHIQGVDPEFKMYDKVSVKINCDPRIPAMEIKEKNEIMFSYDVSFVESDIKWPSRWDIYLEAGDQSHVHWFSIMNSLMIVTILAGIILVILFRTVRRDLMHYENVQQTQEEISGWKLLSGDVFRAPTNPDILCVMVGDGVQILAMGVITILFAAIGFMSPSSRGALINGMLFFYVALGFAGGYVSAKLYRTINNGRFRGWVLVSLKTSFFFTGIVFIDIIMLNFLLWGSQSSGALPLSSFGTLLLLWSCVSTPLTLVGSYFGARSDLIRYPTKPRQIPRDIPSQNYPSWMWTVGAGAIPFATLFMELFFIMSSFWHGQAHYVFGFLFIVMVLLVLVCAEISLVLTYIELCAEDWQWWWRSFFTSGSVAIYVLIYSVLYLVVDLQSLSGPVSAWLYIGYSLLIVFAVFLATGAVGFLSSFCFVYYLFSSVKQD